MEVTEGEASCQILPFINDGISEEAASRIRLLTHLYVPEEHRRNGHATKLLQKVAENADEAQLAIVVQPGSYGEGATMDEKALEAFYTLQDYVKLQDQPLIMVRYPKKPVITQKPIIQSVQGIYH